MVKRPYNFIDITNQTFFNLTALEYVGHIKDYSRNGWWKCLCKCGNTTYAIGNRLRNGKAKSCGCLVRFNRFIISYNSTTHGLSKTRFYKIYIMMKQRCYEPTHKSYPNYGGRGIKVCPRWMNSFENFRDDMYESYLRHVKEFGEKNTSMDRIKVNGNYESSNCKWATLKEQLRGIRKASKTKDYDQHIYWMTRLRKHLSRAISGNYKKSNLLQFYLGITLIEFRKYLQINFVNGMNWHNYGKGENKWCMDHIIACNQFDLSKEKDRLVCFNYQNLRPYWYKDNMRRAYETVL
jgi:hypothetical protein